MRALPPPRNSTSTISSPLEAATRSAISRTRSTSSAMNPIAYRRWRQQPRAPKLKSGLAPTGVLRQMPVVHNSSQLLNIRPWRAKRQTGETGLAGRSAFVIPTARALLHARRNLNLHERQARAMGCRRVTPSSLVSHLVFRPAASAILQAQGQEVSFCRLCQVDNKYGRIRDLSAEGLRASANR